MKHLMWLGLLLALLAGQAGAANNAPVSVLAVPSGSCPTWPNCPAVANGPSAPIYASVVNQPTSIMLGGSLPPFASPPTVNLGTLNGAALDSSLQSIFGLMPGKNGDGGALAHITNFPATQAVTTNGFPLVGSPAAFTVTTSSTPVTGLTLPGKVRFQASPVSTLGQATGSTVSIQINYSGGNACTAPNVILGPGQIDDWVLIPSSTAPTVCAASAGGILLTVQ